MTSNCLCGQTLLSIIYFKSSLGTSKENVDVGPLGLRTCFVRASFVTRITRILTAVKYFAINYTSFNVTSDSSIVLVPVLQVDS